MQFLGRQVVAYLMCLLIADMGKLLDRGRVFADPVRQDYRMCIQMRVERAGAWEGEL